MVEGRGSSRSIGLRANEFRFERDAVIQHQGKKRKIRLKIAERIATTTRRQSLPATTLALALAILAPQAHAQVEYVDPTIGNVGILLEPTRPAVYLPNSMVRVYPDSRRCTRRSDRILPAHHQFASHARALQHHARERIAPAAYDQEKTTPYYYSMRFDDSLIQTEFSPTERCGYFRFTFPQRRCLRRPRQPPSRRPAASRDNAVLGEENFDDMKAYVYGEFSSPGHVQIRRL